MTKTANDVRLFSVEQANRTLPLVSRIVADIVAEYPRWRDLVSRFELAAAGARSEGGESDAMRELREAVDASAARIGAYLGELDQVGCRLKGFEQGLVDFHAMYQGRFVLLCWRQGEPAVAHWHEADAGFAGRQSITAEFAAAVAEAAT
jgi:hypothetical protein